MGRSLDPAIHLQLLALSDLRPQDSYSAFLHSAVLGKGGNWTASQLVLAISWASFLLALLLPLPSSSSFSG